MFFQSGPARDLLRYLRQVQARLRVFGTGPRVYLNSLPKAGTHLVSGLLDATPGLYGSGLHLPTRSVNRESNPASNLPSRTFDFDLEIFARRTRPVRRGQYFTSHLRYDDALHAHLTSAGWKTVFVVRDPRDILLSNLHYVVGLKRHPLHELLTHDCTSDEARLLWLLEGSPPAPGAEGPRFAGLVHQLEAYAPWLEAEGVHHCRFEDFVGDSEQDHSRRLDAIRRLLDYLFDSDYTASPSQVSSEALRKKSFTFRKGGKGGWRQELPPAVLERLQSRCGSFLARAGYAVD